jgi:Arc/MetJ-type ribon-helix-helix transcriptional regulator
MACTLDDLLAELDASPDESALSPEGKKALATLRALLEEGERSGPAGPFDFDEFLARKNAEASAREKTAAP